MLILVGTAHATCTGGINCTYSDQWGTPEVPGNGWLTALGGGVPIYSNGPDAPGGPPTDTYNCFTIAGGAGGDSCPAGTVPTGIEWQCVELVHRLYLTKGWITSTWSGYGYQLYGNAPSSLTKEAQGSVTHISPGDVVAMSGGWEGLGHVAVVSSVSGNSFTIASQNTNVVYDTSFGLSNGSITTPGWGNYTIQGVVHYLKPPTPTSPVPWNFETLDGDSGSVGQYVADVGQNAQSIVYNNSLQVFYYDRTNGRLRHAWQNNGSWTFEVLDGNGGANGRTTDNVGAAISLTSYNGTLQVFYYDTTAHSLRHAWSDANGWHFETLDSSGDVGSASTAFTYGTSLELFYPNLTNGDLRHAWSDANGWHFENLDGDSGSVAGTQGQSVTNVGASLTSTLDANGNIQLFYYASSSQGLRHAWSDANGWHFENLDGGNLGSVSGNTDSIGQNPSVVLDGTTIELFSYEATTGNLRHAWQSNGSWSFENLDGKGSAGPDQYSLGLYSSTVMSGTTLQLFYYDSQWGELRHAWSDTNGWHFENLDGLGGSPAGRLGPYMGIGKFPNAVIFNSVPQVFYYDATNGNLRHTWSQ